MDTSASEITFDADGVCSFCRHYEARAARELFLDRAGQAKLARLVDEIKAGGRGREYDCVIGLSGGVDSSYVAYTVKQLGLRPLAIHLDNGWNSETSVNNVERLVTTLGIDLFTYVLDWEEFRDLHLAFLRSSVINSEIPTDHAITAILYHTTADRGIRYIISGSNIVTEAILPDSWGYDNKDWRHIKAIHRRFGTVRLRTFPRLTLFHWAYYTFVRRTRFIPILNYVPYNRVEAMRVLERELGWRNYGGKHHESIYTKVFQAYILPTKFGIDKRRAHLSTTINSGQTTREAALAELEKPAYDAAQLKEDLHYFVKKLGVEPQEWDRIMQAPAQDFRQYPNNHYWFAKLGGLVRLAKRIATRT
jgi:N-acetyl sugar amidotransferase